MKKKAEKKKSTMAEMREELVSSIMESGNKVLEKDDRGVRVIRMDLNKIKSKVFDVISTQVPSLDLILSKDSEKNMYGMPVGRIVEVSGKSSSGKSTLAFHIASEVQKRGGIAYLFETEFTLLPEYADRIVDMEKLIVVQTEDLNQSLNLIEDAIRKIGKKKKKWAEKGMEWTAPIVMILDSIAGAEAEGEANADIGSSNKPGVHARLLSQAFRRLPKLVAKEKILMLFVNQTKTTIPMGYGQRAQETTLGGSALRFHSSIRLSLVTIKLLRKTVNGEKIKYGATIKATTIKNKLMPPFKEATFDIIFGKGLDFYSGLLEAGLKKNIFDKKGSFISFKYNDEIEKIRGIAGLEKLLEENPEMKNYIVSEISGSNVEEIEEETEEE